MTSQPTLRQQAEREAAAEYDKAFSATPPDEAALYIRARLAERRTVTFQTRIDAARDWARQHLEPEQQAGLLAVLRGDGPALG